MPTKFLGAGVNGRVYETNDGRLIKFIHGNNPKEFTSLRNLQGTHVVPRVKNGEAVIYDLTPNAGKWIGGVMFPRAKKAPKALTIFLMGKVGGNHGMTLAEYLHKNPTTNKTYVQKRVEYLIEQMHLKGVAHGDLHAGNIIVSVSPTGGISGMWVIDFGRSYKINYGETERQAFKKLPYQGMHNDRSIFFLNPKNGAKVQIRGNGSRANVYAMNVHYEKRINQSKEKTLSNARKFVTNEITKYLRSPKRTVGPRKVKSASPVARAN